MPDRSLDSLSSDLQPLVFAVLARLVERGEMVMVVQTSRTQAEADQNLANGTSATNHSKHLPRNLRNRDRYNPADNTKCDAIDLCPYDVWELAGPDKLQWTDDDKGHPAFALIGEIGESLGLRWGGRWDHPHDPGHLEWLFGDETYPDIPPTSAAYAAHHGPVKERP